MSGAKDGFDPAGPASAEDGLYGLGSSEEEAGIHVIPVPFEVTTSYRTGTAHAPGNVLEASLQVDLYDIDNGRPYERGIALLPEDEEIRRLNETARPAAEAVIAAGGRWDDDVEVKEAREEVEAAGFRMNEIVRARAEKSLDLGKTVGLLGGDHATPFGLIEALAERHPGLGILHVDAHHDLRRAYEGFTWSHASIMHNVLERVPGVSRIVQVGIRDFSEEEAETAARDPRVVCYYDQEIRKALFEGGHYDRLVRIMIQQLPETVHVSFDIDGLDPKLCPGTGTPVPGGLDFEEAVHLLRALRRSGRRIVGFDLVEVGPGEWDAIVGARMLYKLCGFARG